MIRQPLRRRFQRSRDRVRLQRAPPSLR
jgi:hypothetical protein